MSKKILALLLAVVMVLSLVACGASEPAATEAPKTDAPAASEAPAATEAAVEYADTIVYGLTYIADGDFMPVGSVVNWNLMIHRIVYSSLLTSSPNGQLEEYLAKSYEVSEDGMVYTFHLHENAVWDDGEPVTAHDVAFTLNLLADATNDSQDTDKLLCIKGVPAYREGTVDSVEGIKVIDDYTFELTLETPSFAGVAYIVQQAIIPEHVWSGKTYLELSEMEAMTAEEIVGCGPYKMTEYVSGEYITLEANPNFFLGNPITNTMILKAINADAASVELTSGNIDIVEVSDLATDEIALLESQGFSKVTFYDDLWQYGMYNPYSGFAYDPALKQAVQYALDRDGIVTGLLEGRGAKIDVPLTPASWAYPEDFVGATYDPELAKSILAEAGWADVDGDGFLEDPQGNPFEFTVYAPTGTLVRERSAVVFAENLCAIGINANARVEAMATAMADVYTDKIDLILMGFSTDSIDPDPTGMMGGLGYPEEAFAIAAEAATTSDPAVRKALYSQIGQIQVDTGCCQTLYVQEAAYVYASNIVNYTPGTYNLYYNIHLWGMEQ